MYTVGRQNKRELYGVRTFQLEKKAQYYIYCTVPSCAQIKGEVTKTYFFVPPFPAELFSSVTANEKDKDRILKADRSLLFPLFDERKHKEKKVEICCRYCFQARTYVHWHKYLYIDPITTIFNTFFAVFL